MTFEAMKHRTARPLSCRHAVGVLVAALLCLPGCGGSGVTGTYVAEENGADGESMRLALELRSGGVAVMTIGGPNGQSLPPVQGTYTVEGDRVTTVLDNDPDVLTLKDGALTMDFFGENVVLKKR
jgi:hypothetical protein